MLNFISTKTQLKPKKDFLKTSRGLFINELKKQKIVTEAGLVRILLHTRMFAYGLTGILVITFFSAGATAYAEIQNVPYQHPLYQLKRLGEKVQTKVVPKTTENKLHNKFAQRRLDELKEMKNAVISATSTDAQASQEIVGNQEKIIDQLNRDFHNEVRAALTGIEPPQAISSESTPGQPQGQPREEAPNPEPKPEEEKSQKRSISQEETCAMLFEQITEHQQIASSEDSDWAEFNKKCGKIETKNIENDDKEEEQKTKEDKNKPEEWESDEQEEKENEKQRESDKEQREKSAENKKVKD